MSDTNDKKPNAPRRPLSLKGGSGTVRQSFSGGRSKSVVVEKKKRRVVVPGQNTPGAAAVAPKPAPKPAPVKPAPAPVAKPTPVVAAPPRPKPLPPVSNRKIVPDEPAVEPVKKAEKAKPAPAPKPTPRPAPTAEQIAQAARDLGLSTEEYIKRQNAINKASAEQSAREARHQIEEANRQRRMQEEKDALDAKRKLEEEEELRRLEEEEEERKRIAVEEARRAPSAAQKALAEGNNEALTELEKAGGRIKKKRTPPPPTRSTKSNDRRRQGKLTIVSALAGDDDRQRSLASMRRAREKEKARQRGDGRDKVVREVVVPEFITVADLANRMSERAADVVKYLMTQGSMIKMHDALDQDTAQLIVEDFGHTVKRVSDSDVEDNFLQDDNDDDEADMVGRPPVIAVMGHVDHGKTSLIDALRSTDVVKGEAGGITQHIGAYQLKLKNGDRITVLDTPGHAAFSEMRSRGAEAVDIVVLVVAADDGIMPQTIESIKFARNADTPIIVAINKMDAYEANALKVETDLLQHEIVTESMSGEVQAIQVSALKKTGLDDLVEAIVNQAELMDLKANPKRNADGLVIESKIEKGRGPVSTMLVKRGQIKRGDIVVAGQYWGKVKAMMDERNARLKSAGPSLPVQVMGLDGAPAPGEPFAVVESEAKAREITEYREREARKAQNAAPSALASMEQMMAKLQDKVTSEMTVLVKADVQGSAEAIKTALQSLGNDEVSARVVYAAAGGISESDVVMAKQSESPILAFNVRANRQAKELAEREGVEIRYYSVIYSLLDEIKGALEGMLQPERRETFIGYAEALEIFDISKLGKIAGCRVTEGRVERGSGVRLLRDDVVIHEGELSTLKRFKEEVSKVQAGMECGMGFAGYHDLRKGDQIECFTVEMLDRKLE